MKGVPRLLSLTVPHARTGPHAAAASLEATGDAGGSPSTNQSSAGHTGLEATGAAASAGPADTCMDAAGAAAATAAAAAGAADSCLEAAGAAAAAAAAAAGLAAERAAGRLRAAQPQRVPPLRRQQPRPRQHPPGAQPFHARNYSGFAFRLSV